VLKAVFYSESDEDIMTSDAGKLIDNFTVDDIPHDVLKDIFHYWQVVKDERAMPSRADLNPADIASLLRYLSLVDVDRKEKRYRMRLVGTETVRALGADITGKYLDELPRIERHLKARYDWIVKEKRPYMIIGKLQWSQKSFLDFCSIGLPLSNNGHDVDIIMYGSCFHLPE